MDEQTTLTEYLKTLSDAESEAIASLLLERFNSLGNIQAAIAWKILDIQSLKIQD